MAQLEGTLVPTVYESWGYSSVGRALLLHGRCQRFESAYLQKSYPVDFNKKTKVI